MVIALGGSTNAVLHLLAMAHAGKVKLTLDDFTRIGKRVPVLADLKPSGKHLMSELVAIGGIRPLMKTLLDAGLLHGDCLTVTGQTMAETLASVQPYPEGQTIIRPLDQPIKKDSHLVILYGNLAPEGAVAKITGKEGLRFTGKARVFDSEETGDEEPSSAARSAKATSSSSATKDRKADRACAKCSRPPPPSWARASGKDVALITDGRFSGGSHGFVVGHITPGSLRGRPDRAGQERRPPSPSTPKSGRSTWRSPPAELKRRRKAWKAPQPRYTRGVLAKYASTVTSASLGAVTDLNLEL